MPFLACRETEAIPHPSPLPATGIGEGGRLSVGDQIQVLWLLEVAEIGGGAKGSVSVEEEKALLEIGRSSAWVGLGQVFYRSGSGVPDPIEAEA